MKILMVVAYFVPEIGSTAHIYFDLAKAFVKRGHEVDVITSYSRKFNLETNGIHQNLIDRREHISYRYNKNRSQLNGG